MSDELNGRKPRIGACVEHGDAAEFYEDGGVQCLYCCQVETSCDCTGEPVAILTDEQVDQFMFAIGKLDTVLDNFETTRKPRTVTKVVYRDPPDPEAVELSGLARSIEGRLNLIEARQAALVVTREALLSIETVCGLSGQDPPDTVRAFQMIRDFARPAYRRALDATNDWRAEAEDPR